MLFGKDRTESSEDTNFSFPSSLRSKARTPISQSINFSAGAMTQAAVRRLKIERAETKSKQTYTLQGNVEEYLVGHLFQASA